MAFFFVYFYKISEQGLIFCAKNEHYEFAIFGAKIQIFNMLSFLFFGILKNMSHFEFLRQKSR